MKRMRITLVTAAVIAAIIMTTTAFADTNTQSQTGQATTLHAKAGRGKLWKQLGLTTDQIGQLRSIRQGAKAEASKITNDPSLGDADKQTKLKELRKQTRQQMLAVLTPDQVAKLKQLRAARRQAAAE